MKGDISAARELLKNSSIQVLKKKYEELFGLQETSSTNSVWLYKKIAYRLQELEHGGLSEKAQTRLKELTQTYDPVNNSTLRPDSNAIAKAYLSHSYRDKRLPIPGSILERMYQGKKIEVKVLEKGFEYNGRIYKSLTAVSKLITGSNWNAFSFFKL